VLLKRTQYHAQRFALLGAKAGVDSAWKQKKLEARKIARKAAPHTSVQCIIILVLVQDAVLACLSEQKTRRL
jgi:hypothetical protein